MPRVTTAQVSDDKFEGRLDDLGGALSLSLVGTLGQQDPQAILDPFFATVHRQARERQLKEILVDMTRLEFMNSSAFKSFLSWTTKLKDCSPGERYRLKIMLSRSRRWQSLSLNALRTFAPDTIECVEVD